MKPLVFIILLNWNNGEETLGCLESLCGLSYKNFHVLVVDNGSDDGSLERLRAWSASYPYAVLANRTNKGFAGGCNTGIRYALAHNADYVLLLNNDTTIDPAFLSYLVSDMEEHPRAGIAGPAIYFYDRPDRLWFNGGKINYGGMVTGIVHSDIGKIQTKAQPEDTEFITGCALMGRAEMWRTAGLMDERFFLYFEDADINMRAKKAGWGIRFVPQAKIWHKVSVTTLGKLGAPRVLYYHYRNALLFTEKHAPIPIRAHAHIWAVYMSAKQIVKLAVPIFPHRHSWMILRGVVDYYMRRFGKLS